MEIYGSCLCSVAIEANYANPRSFRSSVMMLLSFFAIVVAASVGTSWDEYCTLGADVVDL